VVQRAFLPEDEGIVVTQHAAMKHEHEVHRLLPTE